MPVLYVKEVLFICFAPQVCSSPLLMHIQNSIDRPDLGVIRYALTFVQRPISHRRPCDWIDFARRKTGLTLVRFNAR